MASRGGMVAGTTGADYMHREKVAPHYQLSVVYKGRLRWCLVWHGVLLLTMLLKLLPDILDRLDIFVLELEQLDVPKPLLWEYIWPLSIFPAIFLHRAGRRNAVASLRRARLMLLALGVGPAAYALVYWAPVMFECEEQYIWQELCLGSLWCWFLLVVGQLHALQMYCAWRLLQIQHARRPQQD